MKFPHLAMGERFVFEGRIYRKTGPIAATDETTGQTRMIPRYARLAPVDGEPVVRAKPAPSSALSTAFDTYDAECNALLDAHQIPTAARAKLLAARDALITLLSQVKS